MKKILIFLIFLIMFVFVGCNNDYYEIKNSDIPSLTVTNDNQKITVKRGGYSWTVKNTNITTDTDGPEKIAENMEGDIVLPNTQLNMKFTQTPSKVNVIYWGELKDVEYSFTENSIIVPKKEGIYVFEVAGEWEQGRVSYTIKIIVKNN